MNNRNMKPFYHFLCIIARPLLKAFFKFQVFGLENVPKEGSVMLMINHASYLDPIVIGGSVNRNLYYMARSTLFRPLFVKRFLTSLNAFPIHLGSPDRVRHKKAIQILNEGNLLLIFPEEPEASMERWQRRRMELDLSLIEPMRLLFPCMLTALERHGAGDQNLSKVQRSQSPMASQ